jgi:hypothetical protein
LNGFAGTGSTRALVGICAGVCVVTDQAVGCGLVAASRRRVTRIHCTRITVITIQHFAAALSVLTLVIVGACIAVGTADAVGNIETTLAGVAAVVGADIIVVADQILTAAETICAFIRRGTGVPVTASGSILGGFLQTRAQVGITLGSGTG